MCNTSVVNTYLYMLLKEYLQDYCDKNTIIDNFSTNPVCNDIQSYYKSKIGIDNFGTLKYNFQKTSKHIITFVYYTNIYGDYVKYFDRFYVIVFKKCFIEISLSRIYFALRSG